jgi:hypothetical protein
MKSISTLASAALVFSLLAAGATAAWATKIVPKMSEGELKARCEAGGGLYFPPGAGGVYACLTKSGDLVSCGGTSDDCSINRTGPVTPKPGLRSVPVGTLSVAPQ